MDELGINRHRVSHIEYIYTNFLQNTTEPDLICAFNSSRRCKRFGPLLPDAYVQSPAGFKIYFVHGCVVHGKSNYLIVS